MKTITNGTIVKRVDDVTAQENVKKGWQYCPKSSWKVLLRANTVRTGQERAGSGEKVLSQPPQSPAQEGEQ